MELSSKRQINYNEIERICEMMIINFLLPGDKSETNERITNSEYYYTVLVTCVCNFYLFKKSRHSKKLLNSFVIYKLLYHLFTYFITCLSGMSDD